MGVGIYVLMKDSEGGSREMSLYKEVLVGPELERVCLSKPILSQKVLVHSDSSQVLLELATPSFRAT